MRSGFVKGMHLWSLLAGMSWLALAAMPAHAQIFHQGGQACPPPLTCPTPPLPYPAPLPAVPGVPTPGAPTPPTPSVTPSPMEAAPVAPAEQFAEAGAGQSFTPGMLGDLGAGGYFSARIQLPNRASVVVKVPVAARGAFKIAENESPRPVDRFFLTYNYFNGVRDFSTLPDGSGNFPRFDLHRETVGFEKTFFDQNASFGLRVPFIEEDGGPDVKDIGDLTAIFKYAFINDRNTGNVWSGGLAVTAPTGRSLLAIDGRNVHPTLLQPYSGYILNGDDWFVQGFTSLIVPTEQRDVTLLLNDVGFGYRMIQRRGNESALTYVVPTIEGHVTTPLNHRGVNRVPIGFPDIVVLTEGFHLGLWQRTNLALGIAEPITGPNPFAVEAIVELNIRF